jgi:ABC-type glycerol-3-phosphate transport system substrate-binding protein
VFFSLQSAGQPGVVEEQFTQGVYSRDGSKSGNLARNFHYLVSQKSKQKDISWQFLRWMNDGPDYRMQNFQTHVFGFPPSVKNYDMPKFFPEQMKKAFNESMNTPNQTGLPVMRGLPEIYNIFRDNHDAMMNGSQTAADFTKKVDEETKKVLQSIYG